MDQISEIQTNLNEGSLNTIQTEQNQINNSHLKSQQNINIQKQQMYNSAEFQIYQNKQVLVEQNQNDNQQSYKTQDRIGYCNVLQKGFSYNKQDQKKQTFDLITLLTQLQPDSNIQSITTNPQDSNISNQNKQEFFLKPKFEEIKIINKSNKKKKAQTDFESYISQKIKKHSILRDNYPISPQSQNNRRIAQILEKKDQKVAVQDLVNFDSSLGQYQSEQIQKQQKLFDSNKKNKLNTQNLFIKSNKQQSILINRINQNSYKHVFSDILQSNDSKQELDILITDNCNRDQKIKILKFQNIQNLNDKKFSFNNTENFKKLQLNEMRTLKNGNEWFQSERNTFESSNCQKIQSDGYFTNRTFMKKRNISNRNNKCHKININQNSNLNDKSHTERFFKDYKSKQHNQELLNQFVNQMKFENTHRPRTQMNSLPRQENINQQNLKVKKGASSIFFSKNRQQTLLNQNANSIKNNDSQSSKDKKNDNQIIFEDYQKLQKNQEIIQNYDYQLDQNKSILTENFFQYLNENKQKLKIQNPELQNWQITLLLAQQWIKQKETSLDRIKVLNEDYDQIDYKIHNENKKENKCQSQQQQRNRQQNYKKSENLLISNKSLEIDSRLGLQQQNSNKLTISSISHNIKKQKQSQNYQLFDQNDIQEYNKENQKDNYYDQNIFTRINDVNKMKIEINKQEELQNIIQINSIDFHLQNLSERAKQQLLNKINTRKQTDNDQIQQFNLQTQQLFSVENNIMDRLPFFSDYPQNIRKIETSQGQRSQFSQDDQNQNFIRKTSSFQKFQKQLKQKIFKNQDLEISNNQQTFETKIDYLQKKIDDTKKILELKDYPKDIQQQIAKLKIETRIKLLQEQRFVKKDKQIKVDLKEVNLKNNDEINKFNYFEYLDKLLKDKNKKITNNRKIKFAQSYIQNINQCNENNKIGQIQTPTENQKYELGNFSQRNNKHKQQIKWFKDRQLSQFNSLQKNKIEQIDAAVRFQFHLQNQRQQSNNQQDLKYHFIASNFQAQDINFDQNEKDDLNQNIYQFLLQQKQNRILKMQQKKIQKMQEQQINDGLTKNDKYESEYGQLILDAMKNEGAVDIFNNTFQERKNQNIGDRMLQLNKMNQSLNINF